MNFIIILNIFKNYFKKEAQSKYDKIALQKIFQCQTEHCQISQKDKMVDEFIIRKNNRMKYQWLSSKYIMQYILRI